MGNTSWFFTDVFRRLKGKTSNLFKKNELVMYSSYDYTDDYDHTVAERFIPTTTERILNMYKDSDFDELILSSEFNGKLYIDPKFGFPKEFCRIDGVTLNGKFEVETFIDEDEYVMKFIDNTSGNHICIYFNTLTEKMKFSDMVYSDKEIIQTNTTEFNVAENLNNNVLYKTKKKIREEKKEEFKTNNPKMVARAKKAKVVTGSILAAIAGATAYVLTRQKDSK